MWKKILVGLSIVITAVLFWQWELLSYGWYQAKGQLEIIRNAKPIEEVLLDPGFPDSLKQKLRLAKEVRTFAMQELGLNHSDNYTTVYDQQGKVLLWNLSACEPYQLSAYQWYFPFLGYMPYKGFFDLEKAREAQAELDSLGYDTRIRPVGGWSTLGILKDPILSNMLQRSDGYLAEVIIHELTHATIFVKNEIEFNENLASFIGERGAELFLSKKYGNTSSLLQEYVRNGGDQKKLTMHILRGANYLDSLYREITEEPTSVKLQFKTMAIDQIIASLDTVSFYNEGYKRIFENQKPNNAYFMAHMRYHSQEDTLAMIYNHYDQDLVKLIEGMKMEYAK